MKKTVYNCSILEFKKISDRSGSLTPVESFVDLPFEVKRIFYIYDIPGGKDRGAHAHKECHQILIAASGAFDVEVNDGRNIRTFKLDRPNIGLHIPPGLWAAERSFSSGSICLVLTSHHYLENDYIRDYQEYLKYVKLGS